jgi:hypothetical protein
MSQRVNTPFDYDEQELEIPEAIERGEWKETPLSEEELTAYTKSAEMTTKLLENGGNIPPKQSRREREPGLKMML